jgi:glycerol-3-phosphate dehydrogenase
LLKVPRRQSLTELKENVLFDLLVIGGGATGCGVALDAATRGLRVALVEKNDFAEGTSGRSTKLLHGGVRYLESAVKDLDIKQFHLVRDGLKERSLILRLAPHLCHRIPLVTPLYRWTEVPYIYAGLKFYDLLAGKRNIGSSRYLSRSQALKRFPMIRAEGLKGGVRYFDGQFNDARMAVSLALTAAAHGAAVFNHCPVVGLIKESGKISGAVVKDHFTENSRPVRARVVINATGPFADNIRRFDDPGIRPILKVTSGAHMLIDGRFSPPDTGLLIPKTEDGRVLFIMPWEGSTLVGTTDQEAQLSEHPRAEEEELDYLKHYICKHFDLALSKGDIKATWSGLRPLIFDPKILETAKLSRDHVIVQSPSGLITIAGGKWTTYRKMAEDTVDHAVRAFGLEPLSGCRTEGIFIRGGESFDSDGGGQLAREFGLDEAVASHINHAYGDRGSEVAAIAASGFSAPLNPGHPYLEAEVVYAAKQELAQRAMDVLARRVPLALLDTGAAAKVASRVIRIMAQELGWNEARCAEEEEIVHKRLREGI